MRGLSLIEDSASPFCPVDPRQGEGASQEVACEPLEAIGVLRPDGGRVVHGKAATMERAQKLDSLVAQKVSSLQQEEGFVSEQLLGDGGIDVGNGKPSSLGVPDSSGCKAMDMGVWVGAGLGPRVKKVSSLSSKSHLSGGAKQAIPQSPDYHPRARSPAQCRRGDGRRSHIRQLRAESARRSLVTKLRDCVSYVYTAQRLPQRRRSRQQRSRDFGGTHASIETQRIIRIMRRRLPPLGASLKFLLEEIESSPKGRK